MTTTKATTKTQEKQTQIAPKIPKENGAIDDIPAQENSRTSAHRIIPLTQCRCKSVLPLVPDPVPQLVPDLVPQVVSIYKDIDIEKDKENTLGDDDDDFGRITTARARAGARVRACTPVRVCAREDPHSGHSENPKYPPNHTFPYGRSPPFMVG